MILELLLLFVKFLDPGDMFRLPETQLVDLFLELGFLLQLVLTGLLKLRCLLVELGKGLLGD